MVTVVVEGDTDIPVVREIFKLVGLHFAAPIDAGGKSRIDARIGGYNKAARGSPWFVLRDLDHDAECAALLVEQLVPAANRADLLSLRIAEREAESWLLADRAGIAAYLHVSPTLITMNPDSLDDPKREIVGLARRSTRPAIVKGLVPPPGASVSVGPEYEGRIIEFAATKWRVSEARKNSPSLERCIRALRSLKARMPS